MLYGRRFVICGVNRLVVRVARALTAQRAEVIVLRRGGEEERFVRLLPAAATVIDAGTEEEVTALQRAGLADATCLLTLSDDDLDNLRVAVAASEVSTNVPVVLRAFDPALADQLEQGLNIRRAYSMSALAAPAFIAAACGDEVVETLRLGDGEVPICRLTVRPDSPLVGKTTAQIKSRFGCAILARDAPNDGRVLWRPIRGEGDADGPLAEGEGVLVGGPLSDVLRLTLRNADWLREGRRRRPLRRHAGPHPHPSAPRRPTLLPYITAGLLALLVFSIAIFGRALHLRFIDALYFVVTTATTTGYGDISLKEGPDWLKLFGCLVMLSGGALLGILFSYLAAFATAERLDEIMGRRAGRMTDHVIVAGLGNLGYRVARLLTELGMGVVVLEQVPNARFVEAVRARTPVLAGDARLPENAERASVRQAVAFIACTNDDLANIQACLHARRLSPQVATVARVFDDTLAERLTAAFAIDRALSASQCAVSAFVGAATDERALRPLEVGDLKLIACRYTVSGAPLAPDTIAAWRADGIRLLAFRPASGALRSPADLPVAALSPGDEIILCGPSGALQTIITAVG